MYEIPKIAVDVEISLFTDERISGQIFVTEDRQTDAGDPSVAEFLNQDDDVFFPFAGGGSAYRLINKPQVCYLATTQTDREARSQPPFPITHDLLYERAVTFRQSLSDTCRSDARA